jgi:hypothetical protein
MADGDRNGSLAFIDRILSVQLGVPLIEFLEKTWKLLQNARHFGSPGGLYEVLEYESTLELKDRGGERATLKKREKVRYLQDNIIAYHDRAWADFGHLLAQILIWRYSWEK